MKMHVCFDFRCLEGLDGSGAKSYYATWHVYVCVEIPCSPNSIQQVPEHVFSNKYTKLNLYEEN